MGESVLPFNITFWEELPCFRKQATSSGPLCWANGHPASKGGCATLVSKEINFCSLVTQRSRLNFGHLSKSQIHTWVRKFADTECSRALNTGGTGSRGLCSTSTGDHSETQVPHMF